MFNPTVLGLLALSQFKEKWHAKYVYTLIQENPEAFANHKL